MSRLRWIAIGASVLFTTILTVMPAVAASTTRYVDDDGHAGGAGGCGSSQAAHTTIQAAINASAAQDTVIVCGGSYPGRIDVPPNRTGLTIRASRRQGATILATARTTGPLVRIRADDATLDGFRLRALGGSSHCNRTPALVSMEATGIRIQHNDLATVGGRSWGPCGYLVGVDAETEVAATDAYIFDNTIWNWRSIGIVLHAGGVILQNRLHFVHPDGGCGWHGSGPLPDCAQGILVNFSDTPVSVVLNQVRLPNGRVSPGARLSEGIHLWCTEDSYLVQNQVRSARADILLLENQRLLVEDNVVRGGATGIYSDDLGVACLGDDNTFRGNVSTGHSQWDCREGQPDEDTWTDNVGAKADPPGICD